MRAYSSQLRLSLIITTLAIAVGSLSISDSLPPTKLVSTISAQEKGGVVKPSPTPHPRSTPRPSTRTSTTSDTPRRTTAPAKPRQTAPHIEMVLIPAGTFMMGSPNGDEHPQHRVTVRSFYMGKYEVTQAQYRAVMGTNPSDFKGDNLPVESISWNDAKDFCRKLSRMTGREYRLPSEAEWEYACRAGTTGHADDVGTMGWYLKNSGSRTHPVGQKLANRFGLYDILGNVQEWCEDLYHNSYNGAPADGGAWVSGEGRHRVLRGGTWHNFPYSCTGRVATGFDPDVRGYHGVGFRVVLSAGS